MLVQFATALAATVAICHVARGQVPAAPVTLTEQGRTVSADVEENGADSPARADREPPGKCAIPTAPPAVPTAPGGKPLALDWTKGQPEELWRKSVGWGYSAAVVQGNRVYTMGYGFITGGHEDAVFCLDGETGKTVWPQRVGMRASGVFIDPKYGQMPVYIGRQGPYGTHTPSEKEVVALLDVLSLRMGGRGVGRAQRAHQKNLPEKWWGSLCSTHPDIVGPAKG